MPRLCLPARNRQVSPTSSEVTLRRSGAVSAMWSIMSLKSFTPDADSVRIGPALIALTNPTTNSFKRLVPGFEAPNRLAYSSRNRSAAVRIPMYSPSPKSRRFEFRCPDPSCNPYLAFSALTMAAIDGIRNKIDPGQPFDKNLYDLPPEEKAKVPSTPFSLQHALKNLESNHDWLLKGEVFSEDSIQNWIAYKTENEVDQMRVRPHPYEYLLYYDC